MGRRQSKAEIAAEENEISAITSALEALTDRFVRAENFASTLTGRERQRLYGAGVKNYGFIERAWAIARENPASMPAFFLTEQMGLDVEKLQRLRQLLFAADQLRQVAGECALVTADKCYHDSLRVYNGLKEQSRGKVPGASTLFEALADFFRRRKKSDEDIANEAGAPTEKEIERDTKKLIRGKAEGEMVIENEKPRVSGGSRKVVDGVRKGRAAARETGDAVISIP